jgi:hypothetical protein
MGPAVPVSQGSMRRSRQKPAQIFQKWSSDEARKELMPAWAAASAVPRSWRKASRILGVPSADMRSVDNVD